MATNVNIPGTGTPGKPLATKTTQVPVQPAAPITFEAPPASKFGSQPTIDLNAARDAAGQATQAEVDQYWKNNNADEYNKLSQVSLEDQDEVKRLPGYATMNIGQIQQAEKDAAKRRADKQVALRSKAVTSKDGVFKTDMNRDLNMPEFKNPTVTDRGFLREKDIDVEQRKGPTVPAATTGTGTKVPEQKKKEDWLAALGNLFTGDNVGNLVGGLGAAIEAAYGNRSFADTSYGKAKQMEAARKAELEKLGKAQELENMSREDQQKFLAEQNAADRANRLQVSSGAKDVANNRDIALGLFDKSQQPGGTLTKDQVAFVAKTLGIDPMVVASGKLPQVPGSKAFD